MGHLLQNIPDQANYISSSHIAAIHHYQVASHGGVLAGVAICRGWSKPNSFGCAWQSQFCLVSQFDVGLGQPKKPSKGSALHRSLSRAA